jgi:DNA-directed RNA polymerase alpha subunit
MTIELEDETLVIKTLDITATIKKRNRMLIIELTEKEAIFPFQTMAVPVSKEKPNTKELAKALNTSLDDLDLTVRTYNCLKAAKIYTLIDLVQKTPEDLNIIRHFGQKSRDEIIETLKNRGLSLGMDVSEILKENLIF